MRFVFTNCHILWVIATVVDMPTEKVDFFFEWTQRIVCWVFIAKLWFWFASLRKPLALCAQTYTYTRTTSLDIINFTFWLNLISFMLILINKHGVCVGEMMMLRPFLVWYSLNSIHSYLFFIHLYQWGVELFEKVYIY